jgi:hypothetical protein
MAATRHFLGWDAPALPRVVDWLVRQYGRGPALDLSGLLLVTPVARAGRRLIELLATLPDIELIPPALITAGDLPERLYAPEPGIRVCEEFDALLLRVQALRQLPREALAVALPHLPEDDDWIGWFDLAGELAQLDATLEAGGVSLTDIPQRVATMADFPEEERWSALALMQQAYLDVLRDRRRTDRHRARREALRRRDLRCDKTIVLIGAGDLSRVTQAMLAALDSPVIALVHAPPEVADGFDERGVIQPDFWQDRPLAFKQGQVRVVDQPADQVYEALRVLAGIGRADAPLAVDQVTIGLGDETLAAPVQRTLELAGVPARLPAGASAAHSAPARMLAALAAWIEHRRPSDLADLLRHADLEDWLLMHLPRSPGEPPLCDLLDDYIAEHVPARLDGEFRGESGQALAAATGQLQSLWPKDAQQPAPLPRWSEVIASLLESIYSARPLRRVGDDEPLIDALQRIATLLGEHADLEEDDAATPALTLPAAIRLLLGRLGAQKLTPEPAAAAVELLGWLELALDDAPVLIGLHLNEGLVPSSITSDAFLPDTLRSLLGLPDNVWRLARDRAAMEAILHSRRHVTLVAGRRSADGDPLLPSRLLLSAAPADLPERVLAFCQEDARPAGPLRLLPCGRQSQLLICPPDGRPALEPLRVTAFRDYLACPFRFYLKHVLKLEHVDDRIVELDALSFGNVAHDLMRDFGHDAIAASTDARAIADWLDRRLDDVVRHKFGSSPRAPIVLQREILRRRLHVLAQDQAKQTAAGWRIMPDRIECDIAGTLSIDGTPLRLTGRVDRIDEHPDYGYRILDYKTGDSGRTPEKQHCRGRDSNLQWVDLQLPLYHHLAPQNGIAGPAALGYVLLCKDASEIGVHCASWDETQLAGAVECAVSVGRDIRAGKFWPPSDDDFNDEFSALCMDQQMNRREVIRRVTELMARRSSP